MKVEVSFPQQLLSTMTAGLEEWDLIHNYNQCELLPVLGSFVEPSRYEELCGPYGLSNTGLDQQA
jgi:hypothetical protein